MATLGEMFANENVKKVETHPQRVTKWIHYTKLCDHPEQYCNEKNKEEIIQLTVLIHSGKEIILILNPMHIITNFINKIITHNHPFRTGLQYNCYFVVKKKKFHLQLIKLYLEFPFLSDYIIPYLLFDI